MANPAQEMFDTQERIKDLSKKANGLLTPREQEELRSLGEQYTKAFEEWSHLPQGPAPLPSDTASYGSGKSLGELFVGSDTFKGYDPGLRSAPSSVYNVSMKTLLTETGFAPQAIRTGRIETPAERSPKLLDIIASGSTKESAITYLEETTTTNAAASVAEGAEKPESALAYTERTSPVRKIATVLPITDELLDDVPALQAFLNARLTALLRLEVERQMLLGSGAGTDLTGLMVAAIGSHDGTGEFILDAISAAMDKVRVDGQTEPTAVIVHPTDLGALRSATTSDGQYIFGSPMSPQPMSIWGIPIVVTSLMTQGKALVGDFATCAQIFWRSDVAFTMSNSHSDFFVKNKTMLRTECRLGLPIYRLAGFCQVTGL